MKTLDTKLEKLPGEDFEPQKPPYRLKVYGNMDEELNVHGRVMGKLAIKHVRFYHTATETEYIRGNAPESLRLFIADKDPNKVVYVKVVQEEREDKRTGQKKKNYFIKSHAVVKDNGIVKRE